MNMFEEFFGMQHTPFVRDVPVQSLYGSEVLNDTVGRLTYAADRQLFAVVTGDAGSGKSTMIRRFVASLPKDQYITLYLSDSKLTPRWLYKGLLDQLGIESRFYRGDAKRQFQKEVEIIRLMQHKKCVIILDEAHLLDKETLEEFRFLLNYQFDSMSPTALVLVGQNELWEEKLRLRRYAAIRSGAHFRILTGQRQSVISWPIWHMPAVEMTFSQIRQSMKCSAYQPAFRVSLTALARKA